MFIQTAFAQSKCVLNGVEVPCDQVTDVVSGFLVANLVLPVLGIAIVGFLSTVLISYLLSKHGRPHEFNKILDSNENIQWEGNPRFLPFFVPTLFFSLLAWFVMAGDIWFGGPSFSFVFLFMVLFAVILPLLGAWGYRFIYYAITNKRVLLQKGIIGRDFKIVDFDTITNSEVHVGLRDKLFGKSSGTVVIATAGAPIYYSRSRRGISTGRPRWPYALMHIPKPYEVFRIIKDVGHAVKTDIQYPNQYRPQNNPGYNSEYKPNQNQPPQTQPPKQ